MDFSDLRRALERKLHLMNPLLKDSSSWRRSHYIIIENLINEELKRSPLLTGRRRQELGTTISSMTLRRFFTISYDADAVKDLRFIKSVDKMCIFLGYQDFADFSQKYTDGVPERTGLRSLPGEPTEAFFKKFVSDYMTADFQCFLRPIAELEQVLSPYVFSDGPFYKRISDARTYFQEQGYVLETRDNISSSELISVEVVSIGVDSCICNTCEYWYMVYKSKTSGKKLVYNKKNEQVYFFRRRNSEWKIWNNYNPDAGHWEDEG